MNTALRLVVTVLVVVFLAVGFIVLAAHARLVIWRRKHQRQNP